MNDTDAVDHILNNPSIWSEYPELLAKAQRVLAETDSNQKVVSLSDRQVPKLQQRIRRLESEMVAFIDNSRDNGALWNSLLKATLECSAVPTHSRSLELIETTLKSQLNVEHCQIHLPTDELSSAHKLNDDQDEPLKPVTKITFLSGVPDELRRFFEVNHWESIVMIPIAKNSRLGFVSFASSNPNKYTAQTDTEFLEKIGIVVTELLIPGN